MSTFPADQRVKLTKTVVDRATCPPDKAQVFFRDTALPGFGLRVTSGGTKAYIVEKRVNGRVRRQTLGRHGVLTTEQARREAQKFLGQVAMGLDPVAEQRTQAARAATLAEAYEAFKLARKDLKPKTLQDYDRHLNHYLAGWLRKPLNTLTPNMVSQRHRAIGEQHGKAQANAVFRTLKSVLNFARHEYLDGQGQPILTGNPVDILSHTRAWYRVERRKSVIKVHQLPAWYAAVQTLKAPDKPTSAHVIADFLVFVLFTGLRFNEAAQLRWEQVDLRDHTLYIGDPKNREPFTLPLSDFAVERLAERQALAVNEYVFPNREGTGHLVEPQRQMNHVIKVSEVPFTVHDLRRTFITVAESLDISPYALKRMVNHKVSGDVTDGYIISDVARLRAPMQRVTDFLKGSIGLEEPAKVVHLNR